MERVPDRAWQNHWAKRSLAIVLQFIKIFARLLNAIAKGRYIRILESLIIGGKHSSKTNLILLVTHLDKFINNQKEENIFRWLQQWSSLIRKFQL